jgi:hypothetical protein
MAKFTLNNLHAKNVVTLHDVKSDYWIKKLSTQCFGIASSS